MTDTLRNLLRQDADTVDIPTLDATDVIVRGERRLHRRRVTAVLAAVAAVAVITVGGIVAGNVQHQSQGPVDKPTKTDKGQRTVEPQRARSLVYADGTTVHVGDKTVAAEKPVASIHATDDGAVYEAALDGTLWFTDGITTSVIGTSEFTAAPTAHGGVVTTGDSGSLVVWGDVTGRKNKVPVEFVVYDTSRRKEVARIPFTEPGRYDRVVYVDEHHVWFTADTSTHDCWVLSSHRCKDPHLFRFDVASGETTKLRLAELNAELRTRSRMFVGEDNKLLLNEPGFSDSASFRQVGRRLANLTSGGEALTLTRTDGREVRLRLPRGFIALGQKIDASVITTSQWLDDDHIVVWANGGGGDLPAQEGDLLVCELPDGICHVAVPRSSRPYVAP